jgi:hypothetical protein
MSASIGAMSIVIGVCGPIRSGGTDSSRFGRLYFLIPIDGTAWAATISWKYRDGVLLEVSARPIGETPRCVPADGRP